MSLTRPDKDTIMDEGFSAMLFKLMSNATKEQIAELPDEYVKYFSTPRNIHRFCLCKNMEAQLAMFYHLNGEWMFVFAPTKELLDFSFAAMSGQNEIPEKRRDFIEAMANNDIATFSSRQMMMNMMLMDSNTKTKQFQLSQNSKMLMRHKKRWNEMPTIDTAIKEAQDAHASFSKFMLIMLQRHKDIPGITGMDNDKFRVLLALFEDIHKAYAVPAIMKKTNTQTHRPLEKWLNELVEMGCVICNVGAGSGKQKFYMITSEGIKKVMTFHNYLTNELFGKQNG